MVEKLLRAKPVDNDRLNKLALENERLREALTPFAKWAQLYEAAHPHSISEFEHILEAPCPEIAPEAFYSVSWSCFLNACKLLGIESSKPLTPGPSLTK